MEYQKITEVSKNSQQYDLETVAKIYIIKKRQEIIDHLRWS